MASSPLSFAPFTPSVHNRHLHRRRLVLSNPSSSITRIPSPLRAFRKSPNYPHDETVAVVPDPGSWVPGSTRFNHGEVDEEEEQEEEEEEEDDRSLDLLARFLHNLFRKISRRARKQARSLLPPSIPTKLVRFSVNGVLVLGFLWILKSFLEICRLAINPTSKPLFALLRAINASIFGLLAVVCTVGSMVFVSILLVRGIWSGISYIKEQQYYNYVTRMNNRNSTWTGAQPAS